MGLALTVVMVIVWGAGCGFIFKNPFVAMAAGGIGGFAIGQLILNSGLPLGV